jgi:Na+/proline symporter
MEEKRELSLVDYAMFFGSLLAALGIGVWQAIKFRHDGQKEMLVVSKGMGILPLTLSLIATYMSAILLLGKNKRKRKKGKRE